MLTRTFALRMAAATGFLCLASMAAAAAEPEPCGFSNFVEMRIYSTHEKERDRFLGFFEDMVHHPGLAEASRGEQQDVVPAELPPEMLNEMLATIKLTRFGDIPNNVSGHDTWSFVEKQHLCCFLRNNSNIPVAFQGGPHPTSVSQAAQ